MAQIKKSSIESIKQRISISEVASSLVQLKKSGSLLKGLSPFNAEKTPSFFVNPIKNVFKCFSSGHSGDIFTFVMMTENLTFYEAVETLARRHGITVEYEEGGMSKETVSLRSQLFRIHESLASHFRHAFLADTAEAEAIRRYWTEQRGFPLRDAEDFGIGYAPAHPSQLLDELRKEGFSPEVWRESGAFFSRAGETDLRHFGLRFAGRLIVSIRDIQGRVVGFSGRVTEFTPEGPSQDAKYVNSPETPIFQKSQLLFGMDHARRHVPENGALLLVEGQLDAIRCWSSGIDNVVAPQGTAITEHQLTLIRRYTEQVEFLLDGDRAGREAAIRALPLTWKTGLEPRFLILPQGEDPDTLLRNGGAPALEALRQHSLGAVPFLFQTLLPDGFHSDRSQKRKFLQEFFGYLAQVDSRVMQQDILHELARLLGITPEILNQDFQRHLNKNVVHGTIPAEPLSDSGSAIGIGIRSLEWDVLAFLLHYQEYGPSLAQYIHTEWVNTEIPEGEILNRFLAEFELGEWSDDDNLGSLLESEQEQSLVSEMLCHPLLSDNVNELANHCVARLFQRYHRSQIAEVDQQLNDPETSNDPEQFAALQRQRQNLRKLLQSPPRLPETVIT